MLYLLIRAGFEPFRARVIAPRSPTQTSPPDLLAPGFWLLAPLPLARRLLNTLTF
jgi:hypothetical protein